MMTREIKFRVFDVVRNVISYNPNFVVLNGSPAVEFEPLTNNWILSQYTGVKDTNGKEIYEGDIVRIKAFNQTHITNVLFKDGMFGIQWKDYTTLSSMLKILGWFDSLRVLGNIYENPELLEKSKNE